MKVKYSKIIPFKGFAAITLFGTIFIREELKEYYSPDTYRYKVLYNHESIHESQAMDYIFNKKDNKILYIIGFIIFYILYIIEYLIRLFLKLFFWKSKPYKNLIPEVEAYTYEKDFKYLNNRKSFSQYKLKLKL